jgi:hypothetical protein
MAVCSHVFLGRLAAVVASVVPVSVGQLRVVRGLLVVAGSMMLRSFPVVFGRMLVMLGRLGVVIRRLLRHGDVLRLLWNPDPLDIRERRGVSLVIIP